MPSIPAAAAAAAMTSCGLLVAAGGPNPFEVAVEGGEPAVIAPVDPPVDPPLDPAVEAPVDTAPPPTLILIPGVTVGTFFAFSRSTLTMDS